MSIIRKKAVFILAAVAIYLCLPYAELAAETFKISNAVYLSGKMPAESHIGPGAFDTYLVQGVPLKPVYEIYEKLAGSGTKKLINRGEAHITVITPPEYNEILKPYISMQEIERMAAVRNLQSFRFKVVGIGRAEAKIESKTEETYYLIVDSKDILEFRKSVFELYKKKGGAASRFDPCHYYPHITVGFTARDLHESDGVKKGLNSLIFPVEEY